MCCSKKSLPEPNPKVENTICDVCRLVDKDITIKHCEYCTVCKAWICDPCRPRMERRAMAMYKRITGS